MQKIIRDIFVGLDNVIYETIMDVYDLLLTIARTSIMSQAQITEFANRIYELLAIFMVFKVTLSLITYVVNPDSFTEKNQGVGPLLRNIVISLSLLILTPNIFNMAYEAQTYLLEGNTIPKLIFGNTSGAADKINSAGETMAFVSMSAFVSPNTGINDLVSCTEPIEQKNRQDGSSIQVVKEECSGIKVTEDGLPNGKSGAEGVTGLANVTTEEMASNYVAGVAAQNYYLTFRSDLLTFKDKKSKEFVMTYHYFISSAVGVVILLILITFCMDIAVRSIKLAFYQLIAPIPIISYIDPKNGKDGIFKKWYKACFSTYLSLFIRLFVIYFAIYLIGMIADMNIYDVVTGEIVGGLLLKVFMLIGVLMFAKQMPKILEGLGLKIDGGGFTLNPLKKIENEALGGKQISKFTKQTAKGLAGAAAGGMVGTVGALTGAGKARGISGLASGFKSGFKGQKLSEIRKNQVQQNATMRRAIASGSNWDERLKTRVVDFFGGTGELGDILHDKIDTQNKIDNLTAEVAPIKAKISAAEGLKSNISSMEDRAKSKIRQGKGKEGKLYQSEMAALERMQVEKEALIKSGNTEEAGKLAETIKMKEFEIENKLNTEWCYDYITASLSNRDGKTLENLNRQLRAAEAINDTAAADSIRKQIGDIKDVTDATLNNMFREYETAAINAEYEVMTTGASLDSQIGKIATDIVTDKTNIQATEQKIQAYKDQLQTLNAQERDAKASVEAVKAVDTGPSNPQSIEQVKRTIGMREGGQGSGVNPLMSGNIGPGPNVPPPGGDS